MGRQDPSPATLKAIREAGALFLSLARAGLPGQGPSPVGGVLLVARAAARLEVLLNPGHLPLDAPENAHRMIQVEGWDGAVALGLVNLRASFHDFLARWRWDALALGEDPACVLGPPLIIPHHEHRLADLNSIEAALKLLIEEGAPALRPNAIREDGPPKQYLFSWPEILSALNLKNNEADRDRVRRLHDSHGGPIAMPERGAQPKVEKGALLTWWNDLEKRWHELRQREADRQGTIQPSHPYGREGTVYPELSGSERKRRRRGGQSS